MAQAHRARVPRYRPGTCRRLRSRWKALPAKNTGTPNASTARSDMTACGRSRLSVEMTTTPVASLACVATVRVNVEIRAPNTRQGQRWNRSRSANDSRPTVCRSRGPHASRIGPISRGDGANDARRFSHVRTASVAMRSCATSHRPVATSRRSCRVAGITISSTHRASPSTVAARSSCACRPTGSSSWEALRTRRTSCTAVTSVPRPAWATSWRMAAPPPTVGAASDNACPFS